MKKLFTFVILLQIAVFPQVFEWQWQNSKPNGNDFTDVRFLSSSKVIAFGRAASVLISNNGGTDWMISYADTARNDIWNSFFLNATTGFIVGDAGLLMKTTDGGLTWNYKNSSTVNLLYDIEFFNADSGIAVGGSGTVIRTTDGGETWTSSAYGTSSLYKVCIISPDLVYAGSTSSTTGRLLKSTDFGATWTNVTPAVISTNVMGMFALNANTIYVATAANGIIATTDGGANWTVQASNTNFIYDVKFSDASNGFGVDGKGIIFKTTNGGTNWTTIQVPGTNKALRAIDHSSGSLFAVGNAGNLYSSSDLGLTWTPKYSSVTQDYLRKMVFKSSMNGWICGGSTTTADSMGFILQTTDGGLNWAKNPYNFKAQVYSLSMPSDNIWYAGRSANKIFKTTDGGSTFNALTTPITSSSHVFWFTGFANDSVGFTGGSSGKVLKTTDGGAAWTDISTAAGFGTNTVYEIAIISADTFFLCGGGARIVKTTNGGTTFTALSPGIAGTFFTVKFKDANFGMVGGGTLGVSVTTDGGSTWTPSTLPAELPSNTSIWAFGFGANHVWLSTINGDICYSADAGLNFHNTFKPTTNTLDAIAVVGDHMWIAGTSGVIVKGFSDPNIPVELVSFTGEKSGSSILLKWTTATETNNMGFEVQKQLSTGEWKSLGFIKGKGTSSEKTEYTFKDKNPLSSNIYRLKQVDLDGSYKYYNSINVNFDAPAQYNLVQNYPNPFNPSTKIKYELQSKGNVELKIYNVLGAEILTLVSQVQDAGNYEVTFNAANLPSGVYFYQLKAGNYTAVRKMMLLK